MRSIISVHPSAENSHLFTSTCSTARVTAPFIPVRYPSAPPRGIRHQDHELRHLTHYLERIAPLADEAFSQLDHRTWEDAVLEDHVDGRGASGGGGGGGGADGNTAAEAGGGGGRDSKRRK
jgi:hypothetical protein